MAKALLDTDIFSEVLRAVDPTVISRARDYHAEFGAYSISTVTVMEIVKGFHRVQREARLLDFMSALPSLEVLTLDAVSAALSGRIYADLERTGQPIGRADPMIAGIAIANERVLVTGNTAHFQRIQDLGYDLRLDNWRAPRDELREDPS